MKERSKDRGMSRYLVQKFGIGMPDRHFLHRVRAEMQCIDGGGTRKALRRKKKDSNHLMIVKLSPQLCKGELFLSLGEKRGRIWSLKKLEEFCSSCCRGI